MKKMKRRRKINVQCGIICNVKNKQTSKQKTNKQQQQKTPKLVHANKQKKQSAT